MRILKAMLLAAGQGTRLRQLTKNLPKPMLPVGGRPLIEHTVRQLARYGVREIAINLHHHPEAVTDHFGDGSAYGVRIEYSYESQLLGTAGAVKKLEAFFDKSSFFVIYGDNLTTCKLDQLARVHHEQEGLATIALFWRQDVSPHSAVEILPDGLITRFIEKPKLAEAPSHWISAGVLLLESRILEYIPADHHSDFGFDIFPRILAHREKVYGYRMGEGEDLWWIDTPDDYWRICDLWKGASHAERVDL